MERFADLYQGLGHPQAGWMARPSLIVIENATHRRAIIEYHGAGRIGEVAGTDYPGIAALSKVSQRSSAAEDFHRGLNIFLTGLTATEPRRGARS